MDAKFCDSKFLFFRDLVFELRNVMPDLAEPRVFGWAVEKIDDAADESPREHDRRASQRDDGADGDVAKRVEKCLKQTLTHAGAADADRHRRNREDDWHDRE